MRPIVIIISPLVIPTSFKYLLEKSVVKGLKCHRQPNGVDSYS